MSRKLGAFKSARQRALTLGAGTLALTVGATGLISQLAWSEPTDVETIDAPAHHTGDAPESITLVTGDRVEVREVDGQLTPHVERAAGREHIPFSVHQNDGELRAVPGDAEPLLAAERVDSRLFDVTKLLQAGHGDAESDALPLTFAGADADLKSTLDDSDESATDEAAGLLPKADAAEFWDLLRSGPDAQQLDLDDTQVPDADAGLDDDGHEITVETLDRDGEPAELTRLRILDLSDYSHQEEFVEAGEASLRLDDGDYHVEAVVYAMDGDEPVEHNILQQPRVSVDSDATLTYDAREAEAVSMSLDADDADIDDAIVWTSRNEADMSHTNGSEVLLDDYDDVYTGHLGDPVSDEELEIHFTSAWQGPDQTGYHLTFAEHGSMPSGYEQSVAVDDMARVEADYRSPGGDARGVKTWVAYSDEGDGAASGAGLPVDLPSQRVEYHNVDEDLVWEGELYQYAADDDEPQVVQHSDLIQREPGETYAETWNAAVFGPGMPQDWFFATRNDDLLFATLPLHSDADVSHHGFPDFDSGGAALYADDELVAESDIPGEIDAEVDADSAEYRLETEGSHSDVSDFSTHVSAAWQFTSEADVRQVLPLSFARFAPEGLDDHNHAEAGESTQIPITVQSQLPETVIDAVEVEASFDDGDTWEELAVVDDDGLSVEVDHPDDAEFVSLQVELVDVDGNIAEHTIVRAYGLM